MNSRCRRYYEQLRHGCSCASGLLMTGCATNQPYHLGEAPTETVVTPTTPQTATDIYRLAFIEFDEQGGFWDREQLRETVQAIRDTSRPILLVSHPWLAEQFEANGR